MGLDLGHLTLPTESGGIGDLTRTVYPAALFLSSFLGLCPLLTSSSLAGGPWLPGNSLWGGAGKSGFGSLGLGGWTTEGTGRSLHCSDLPPFS